MDVGKTLIFDADVIIHFIQGEQFSALASLYPNKKVILRPVYSELIKHDLTKTIVHNAILVFKYFELGELESASEIGMEYARLKSTPYLKGVGESACLAHCRYSDDVVVSSNLRDVKSYCNEHSIDLLTTMDIVKHAFDSGQWTESECDAFIVKVLGEGGMLPCAKISDY